MKVEAACWMKSCTNPKKKLLDFLKQGNLRNSPKVGNCKVEVSVGGIPGDFWRIFSSVLGGFLPSFLALVFGARF
jgi:hypothetical protein